MGETFGEWLVPQILAQYPSRRAFAEVIGLAPEYLTRILKGRVERPEPETCQKIAGALGLDLDVVLEAAGYPQDERPAAAARDSLPPPLRRIVQYWIERPLSAADAEALAAVIDAQHRYMERVKA